MSKGKQARTGLAAVAAAMLLICSTNAQADKVLYDFEDGAQGWGAYGPLTTDSGPKAGLIGQGRYHVADFDLAGWGIVSLSPAVNTAGVNLADYEGIRVAARLVDVAGQIPFSGTAELKLALGIGEAEWSKTFVLTQDLQFFIADFDELIPDGAIATAPITAAQLADSTLQIKLVVPEGGNSGIGELQYDHVTAMGGSEPPQFVPGDVIYDFDVNTNACYPDDWTFFGYAGTDFGLDLDAEDGFGAFHAADWTECDMWGYPTCSWVGSAVGIGLFNHAHCTPGGVDDANLDLSLGTGISMRVKVDLNVGFGGTPGARLQLQVEDDDGTQAVSSMTVLDYPSVNRSVPVPEDWETLTFYFNGLDAFFDNDNSIAGSIPGLDTANIKSIKLLWLRGDAIDINVFEFDEITLIGDKPVLWADMDADDDVDLADFGMFQRCFAEEPLNEDCEPLDADYDGTIGHADLEALTSCLQGPEFGDVYYPWCY